MMATVSRGGTMSSGDASMSDPAGKVAIPRLHRTGDTKSLSKQRHRVSRACVACRNQKVKCSGDTPSCVHCQTTGRECLYVMPRRDRLNMWADRKRISYQANEPSVTDRCVEMARLLRALERDAGPDDSRRINELLEAVRCIACHLAALGVAADIFTGRRRRF